MAERPIFIPTAEADGYVKRVDLEIPWAGGFAEVQKKKEYPVASRSSEESRLYAAPRSFQQVG